MPLYEYVCEQDGTVIEQIRSISQADTPVDDPKGLGRVFKRRFSTFASPSSSTSGQSLPMGGCPCGNAQGPCNR